MNLKPKDRVSLFAYQTLSVLINETLKENEDLITKEVGAKEIKVGEKIGNNFDHEEEVGIDAGEPKLTISVKK